MNNKTITVFGSSLPKKGEKEYEDAYKIGKFLGQNNLNVCTGGFLGIMDAVSKGAKEEGQEAIGITVPLFNSTPSKYLTKEIQCSTLSERLDKLVFHGDAYIILPGGTGTLLELSMIWELMNKGILDNKPIVSLGNMWKTIIETMEARVKFENRKKNLVSCFSDIHDVMSFILNKVN